MKNGMHRKAVKITPQSRLRRFTLLIILTLFTVGCEKDPLTGKSTLAVVDNDKMIKESFSAYASVLEGSTIVNDTQDGQAVIQVGEDLRRAAELWYGSLGQQDYLARYEWEYNLIDAPLVNAWCMPGGKIAVYTGILPVVQNYDALAAVMGHELAHALLNHGRQRQSAEVLKKVGAIVAAIVAVVADADVETQEGVSVLYDLGSTYLGTLPFSRAHEREADEIGLILMTIAGYDPEESVALWKRMSEMTDNGGPSFFSTHPSNEERIADLTNAISGAKEKAASIRQ